MTFMIKKQMFSLVELLTAIAVFLIILVLMLQFLSGTQKIWKGTTGKGDVYIESKAAMDLICGLLREPTYLEKYKKNDAGDLDFYKSLFLIESKAPFDQVTFLTEEPLRSDGGNGAIDWFCVELSVAKDGTLDGGSLSLKNFRIDNEAAVNNYYKKDLVPDWTAFGASDVIDHVTGLEFIPGYREGVKRDGKTLRWGFDKDGSGNFYNQSYMNAAKNAFLYLPDALMVNLRMLDRDNYELYKELPKADRKAFLEQNELTFSRIINYEGREYSGKTKVEQ